jgi:hypothetical protein
MQTRNGNLITADLLKTLDMHRTTTRTAGHRKLLGGHCRGTQEDGSDGLYILSKVVAVAVVQGVEQAGG